MTSINNLKSDHKNARRRTDRSSELIKESLQRYGAARSIVIDEDNRILAGNGTIEGAKAAGIKNVRIIETEGDEIIAVRRSGLSEDQKVGLALADNRTADLSEWDQEMLHRLSEEHDIEPWFNQEDLDELLNVTELDPEGGNTDPDEVPDIPTDPITKPGDLWILGNHRLLCGDAHQPVLRRQQRQAIADRRREMGGGEGIGDKHRSVLTRAPPHVALVGEQHVVDP